MTLFVIAIIIWRRVFYWELIHTPLHPGPEWRIFRMSPMRVSYRSMRSRFPPFAFAELVSPYNKKNATRWLEDMNFMFSWQEQYIVLATRT